MTKYIRHMLLFTAVGAAGCTMANVEPPPLAGPSELALSLTLAANPDVLSLDGASQTLVTVEARDQNGQPAANVPLRVEILADGQVIDFGTISARTLVTNSSGRAQFVYTAPTFVGGTIPNLQLSVTPTGTDASAHVDRLVTVKLVQPGTIGTSPNAVFTVIPDSPAAFTDVRFDGTASTAGLGATIVTYEWDFGDGTSGTGAIATHQYRAVGNYLARLTVIDSNGRSDQSDSQVVAVSTGEPPTAAIVFSPTSPTTADKVFFNGSQSTAGTNHRIVSYRWNFGNGKTGSGSTTSHQYTAPGTYVVVLTVTDEVGQTDTESVEVTVS